MGVARGVAVVGEKPTAEETPYRSRIWVSRRSSADGNAYKPGDPIPEAEEQRQRSRYGYDPRKETCGVCAGSGKRSNKMKNHKPGCGCVGCKPCRECGGSGLSVTESTQEV